ncbi:MAG: cobyric acid synthase [Proteobacteria bacterium]|nr:cobyric acid synthase [Pseudomonadota bacterium]
MLQGTGSDVGKSLLLAGLARAFARSGLKVRPFKPQNMSNNAAVTADGGEIGRAQALQARACFTEPVSDMNPVLLKPQSEMDAQIVVQGRIAANAGARDYYALKPSLLVKVLESFGRLAGDAELILVEGAGSPAEVNLRDSDIANMGFAEAADIPVALIGDIERGGVIASLIGTHALLSPGERRRVKGYIVNKFRGDATLFEPAIGAIEERTGWDCFGVVPFFSPASLLPAEDAMALEEGRYAKAMAGAEAVTVAVPRLPRISNFDDLDPLAAEPGVTIDLVEPGRPLPTGAKLVLLLGSKTTIGDLAFLRAQGWDTDICAHLRQGGRVMGLCGGYQMLGKKISDGQGVEGAPGEAEGLGLLDVTTRIEASKTLKEATGIEVTTGASVRGYEIHSGQTSGPDCARPMLDLEGRAEGARSADGKVMGCYLHGLFAADAFRRAFLKTLGAKAAKADFEARIETTLDELADHLEAHIDTARLLEIARERSRY